MTGTEVWVLCSAVGVLMAGLILIAATSDAVRKHGRPVRHLWGQFGLIGITIILGIVAPVLHRVVLVGGLLAVCSGQTLLGRVSSPAPKLISQKAS